jgi:hypothetical protein
MKNQVTNELLPQTTSLSTANASELPSLKRARTECEEEDTLVNQIFNQNNTLEDESSIIRQMEMERQQLLFIHKRQMEALIRKQEEQLHQIRSQKSEKEKESEVPQFNHFNPNNLVNGMNNQQKEQQLPLITQQDVQQQQEQIQLLQQQQILLQGCPSDNPTKQAEEFAEMLQQQPQTPALHNLCEQSVCFCKTFRFFLYFSFFFRLL